MTASFVGGYHRGRAKAKSLRKRLKKKAEIERSRRGLTNSQRGLVWKLNLSVRREERVKMGPVSRYLPRRIKRLDGRITDVAK